MKKNITSLFILVLNISMMNSQDIIIRNDKVEINAKILEIQEENIRYYLFDQQDGPIRNIRISDVFMVIYSDGTRETFRKEYLAEDVIHDIGEAPAITVDNQASSKDLYEQPEVTEDKPTKYGFVFGGKAGYYIPYNQSLSEIYGSGFMGGLIIGYWGYGAGIEIDWRYYSKAGNPYTYGAVDDADCSISISPLTMTVYWDAYHKGSFSTYIGGGLGAYFIHEDLVMNAYGQTASASGSLTGFEFHTTGGIRFSPFYIEITFSSCTIKEVNFGGIILSGGLFF